MTEALPPETDVQPLAQLKTTILAAEHPALAQSLYLLLLRLFVEMVRLNPENPATMAMPSAVTVVLRIAALKLATLVAVPLATALS